MTHAATRSAAKSRQPNRAAKAKRTQLPLTPVILDESVNIPFNRLRLADANVRKIKEPYAVRELAADIAIRGLLQSLSVRPIVVDGKETGDYEVQAGETRYLSIELLISEGRLAADQPIPCIPKRTGLAEDDSLAENVKRFALHPLDQARAFKAMLDQGMSREDIAARQSVSEKIVEQRLRIAGVSPKIQKAFAANDLDLEQVMAFCATADHKRQDAVFKTIKSRPFDAAAYEIRRMITETAVLANDRRVKLIGLKAYEAAAPGAVERDLFADRDNVYLTDIETLDRLVEEHLTEAKAKVIAQGCKWADASPTIDYNFKNDFRRIIPKPAPLSKAKQKRYDSLLKEHTKLDTLSNKRELTATEENRLDKVVEMIDRVESRPGILSKDDKARSGALISIGHDGRLNIEHGYLKPEDVTKSDRGSTSAETGANTSSAPTIIPGDLTPAEGAKPLAENLVEELTAHRTLAMRNALGNDPETALLALLHSLCLQVFYRGSRHSGLQLNLTTSFPSAHGLAETQSAAAIDKRRDACAKRLSQDPANLWDALTKMKAGDRAKLLAHCVAESLNVVRTKHDRRVPQLRHGEQLAKALDFDMVKAGWKVSAENYFGRVAKQQIVDALLEAKGTKAPPIDHLKKPEMAREAERLMKDTDWLPYALRNRNPADLKVTDDNSEDCLRLDTEADFDEDDDVNA